MKEEGNHPMATFVGSDEPAEMVLNRPYGRILIPEVGGGYSASIEEFQGCFAQGETADETLQNLHRAALSWIEAARESGWPIPVPKEK